MCCGLDFWEFDLIVLLVENDDIFTKEKYLDFLEKNSKNFSKEKILTEKILSLKFYGNSFLKFLLDLILSHF